MLKDAIVQLCVFRPENPVTFLRQYFQKLERVSTLKVFFSKLGARLAVFDGGASSKARLSESGLIGSICAGHTKFVLFSPAQLLWCRHWTNSLQFVADKSYVTTLIELDDESQKSVSINQESASRSLPRGCLQCSILIRAVTLAACPSSSPRPPGLDVYSWLPPSNSLWKSLGN